jgi:hypothetical protein
MSSSCMNTAWHYSNTTLATLASTSMSHHQISLVKLARLPILLLQLASHKPRLCIPPIERTKSNPIRNVKFILILIIFRPIHKHGSVRLLLLVNGIGIIENSTRFTTAQSTTSCGIPEYCLDGLLYHQS